MDFISSALLSNIEWKQRPASAWRRMQACLLRGQLRLFPPEEEDSPPLQDSLEMRKEKPQKCTSLSGKTHTEIGSRAEVPRCVVINSSEQVTSTFFIAVLQPPHKHSHLPNCLFNLMLVNTV